MTNGVIIEYNLKLDSEVIYSGLNSTILIGSLSPFTQYRLILEACTGMFGGGGEGATAF